MKVGAEIPRDYHNELAGLYPCLSPRLNNNDYINTLI